MRYAQLCDFESKISIPFSTIKRRLTFTAETKFFVFQFHLVRLKVPYLTRMLTLQKYFNSI